MTLLSDEDVSNLYVVWDATEGASHADLIRATERKVLRLAELADAQAEIARLRGALESARSYGSESWATWLISEVDDALDTK